MGACNSARSGLRVGRLGEPKSPDNVPSALGVVGREVRNRFCQYRKVDEGLDQSNMVNVCELLILRQTHVKRHVLLLNLPRAISAFCIFLLDP